MIPINQPTKPSCFLGKDYTTDPHPMIAPSDSSAHVLVIGGGVTGFSIAWILLDHGYRVTIVSEDWASYAKEQRLCSQVGGALWEYPNAPCGPRYKAQNLGNVRQWALDSYEAYSTIAEDPELSKAYGIQMRNILSCFPTMIDSHDMESERIQAIVRAGFRGFRHDQCLIKEFGTSGFAAKDAFTHLAPIIDSDQAMSFLTQLVTNKGAKTVSGIVKGDLFGQEAELLQKHGADAIVNASGLSARELANDDTVVPARGGVYRVVNDGKDFPKIEHAIVVTDKDPKNYNIVFIVPRSDTTLILGTFTENGKWTNDLQLDSPIMLEMREKCERFIPALKHARLDPEYPMAQALRPHRKDDVRVEREKRLHDEQPSRIVHAYGHGYGGWSLAFGSAMEAVRLVAAI